MTFQPTAKIIADSINENGDRVTTFELTYHRFIHSELLTHRSFSRNTASSRAIPIAKMIKLVEDSKVEPLHWGANCKGMSAKEELDRAKIYRARTVWDYARQNAVNSAKELIDIGVHKQVVNRLLEPFAPITAIVTATDFDNFFAQRCHAAAQPEIQALAMAMREEYQLSEPKIICHDDPIPWHIPYLHHDELIQWAAGDIESELLLKIATGRCARVSYLNHDGIHAIVDDIALHDKLLSAQPPHLSPFEHCAKPCIRGDRYDNFVGWQSYRNLLALKERNMVGDSAITSSKGYG